jgi:hypothetical protein
MEFILTAQDVPTERSTLDLFFFYPQDVPREHQIVSCTLKWTFYRRAVTFVAGDNKLQRLFNLGTCNLRPAGKLLAVRCWLV